jgi:hypothetical protein
MYCDYSATHNKAIPPKNVFKNRQHEFFRISDHNHHFTELVRLFFYNVRLLLALDDPNTEYNDFQIAADNFFLIYFIIEALFKIFGMGFYFSPNAYIKDNWNKLDFIIVISSIFSKFYGSGNLTFLRVFRVLRPLRSINRIKGLKKMM